MKKVYIIGGAFLLSVIAFFGKVTYVLAENDNSIANSNTICEGVFIDDINIGGMTREQAKSAVQAKGAKIGMTTVTVSANSKKSQISMANLGYKIKADECIEKAVNIGSTGNLIQRYKDVSDAKNGKKIYEAEYEINDSLIDKFVNEGCKACDCEPVEPTMTMSGGAPSVIKGKEGQVIDKADTIAKIKQALSKWDKKNIVVEAKVEVKKPKVSDDALQQCTAKLGTCTTTMTCDSDSAHNINRGTKLVNGAVVAPGETFSIMSKMRPFTTANGYCDAGAILEGSAGKAMGGGICQVATTLYDAALYAELQIVERRSHSAKGGYYDYSFDAMVNDGSSDMKFKNTTDAPIYIEGFVSGRNVTFNIYGKETRKPNREIKFKPEVQINGDVTYAQLYKYVYIGGVQQGEPQQINKSTYKKLKPAQN